MALRCLLLDQSERPIGELKPPTVRKPQYNSVVFSFCRRKDFLPNESPYLPSMDHAQLRVVVTATTAGVCGACGRGTRSVCPSCQVTHFCSAVCLRAVYEAHEADCGRPTQGKPVLLPVIALRGSDVNTRLVTSGIFGLKVRPGAPPPKQFVAQHPFGLVAFSVSAQLARDMAEFVIHSRSEDGYLLVGGVVRPGYHGYTPVQADKVDEGEQSRVTCMLLRSRGHITHCIANCVPFGHLVQQVCAFLGCSVKRLVQAHFVQQQSQQCQFTWHQDHSDMGLSESMITVVVSLKGEWTGMQVWGFSPFAYSGPGSGVAFPGAATHRSVYRVLGHQDDEEDVVKVGFFFD